METKKILYPHQIIYVLIILIVFIASIGTSYNLSLRYVKYLLPFFLGIFLIQQRKLIVNKLLLNNIVLYVILLAVNFLVCIFNRSLSIRFFQESMLIMLPLLSAFLVIANKNISLDYIIKKLFWTYTFVFIIYNFKKLLNFVKLISQFPKALIYSNFPTESWIAFPMSIFTLYFFVEKKYKYFLISSAIFLLAFKRIAIIAIFIAILFYTIYYVLLNKKFTRKIIYFYFIFNVFLLTILYNFISGNFSKLIDKYTGLSVNWLSQGRFQIYNAALNFFNNKLIFGSSLGSTNIFLSKKYEDVEFLHSDILKLIIEFGIISFIIWMFYFLSINIISKKATILVLFVNLLLLTDNVFIYFDTLFVFYIILAKYQQENAI